MYLMSDAFRFERVAIEQAPCTITIIGFEIE